MKSHWTQPSLSRDFALLAASVLFMLVLATSWVSYRAYEHHVAQVAGEMEMESHRIERVVAVEMQSAEYLLGALGKQIALERDLDLIKLAQILKAYDEKGQIFSIFSWIGPNERVAVSSNRGVLDTPVNVSDRDYVKMAVAEPWKMHIGRPIEGRTSERWVIPVALGLTDSTGRFIGTIAASLDIHTLHDHLKNLVSRDGISFAVVSKTLIPLTQVSENPDFVTENFPMEKLGGIDFAARPAGLLSRGSLFLGTYNYSFYRMSTNYPYLILLGYDSRVSDEAVREQIGLRLLQMLFIAGFLVLLLWIIKARIIRPVLDMTAVTAAVAKGEPYRPLPRGGPLEIEALAAQVQRVGDYIQENKRIEDELRNKMFMQKKAKEKAEISRREKSEFMAYLSREMRGALNNIQGFAQAMRDQVYGPIENRKYRQYASDIHQAGQQLLAQSQDLAAIASAETGQAELHAKPLDLHAVLDKALRGLDGKLSAARVKVDLRLHEPLPRLIGDEFHTQQMFASLLGAMASRTRPGAMIAVEARTVSETRDHRLLAIAMHTGRADFTAAELLAAASSGAKPRVGVEEAADIGLELGKTLVELQQGDCIVRKNEAGETAIFVFLPPPCIKFNEEQEG